MESTYPPGWNRTIDDLVNDGAPHSQDELRWAREYERHELAKWARFPRDGEIFESLKVVVITCSVQWKAPYTSGGPVEVPAGTRIRTRVLEFDPQPISVGATPLEYERFESVFVAPREHRSNLYAGYFLSVKTAQLNRDFRLIADSSQESSSD